MGCNEGVVGGTAVGDAWWSSYGVGHPAPQTGNRHTLAGRPKPYHTLSDETGPSDRRGRRVDVGMPPKGFGNCYRGQEVGAGGI